MKRRIFHQRRAAPMAMILAATIVTACAGVFVWSRADNSEARVGSNQSSSMTTAGTPVLSVVPDLDEPDSPSGGGADEVIAVAVGYLRSAELVPELDPAEIAELQASFATAAATDRLATSARQAADRMQTLAGVGEWELLITPLEARAFTNGDTWVVDIWYVAVTHRHGESVTASWRTVTYDLAWERDAWRIANLESADGPTPATASRANTTTIDGFENATIGFSTTGLR